MVENIADAPQVHPLGHTHGYSAALGYAILARVMEVVDGSTVGQNARLRILPDSGAAVVMLTNGGPREPFYEKVFTTAVCRSTPR